MPDGSAGRSPGPIEALTNALGADPSGQEAALRLAAGAWPDWPEPLACLARIQQSKGETASAIATWRSVLARAPDREDALLALTGLLIEAGEPAAACDAAFRLCGLVPHRSAVWTSLGQAMEAAGNFTGALRAFAHAQRLSPRNWTPIQDLVRAAHAAGEAETEASRLEVLGGRDPLNPVPHVARGLLFEKLGRLDDAIDALEAAAALAPAAREPAAFLAGVLSRSPRSAQAEQALRRAVALDPLNPRLLNDHAAVLMRLHRHAEARELLTGILWRNGPHASVLCNLATATCCLGRQGEAVELARAAIFLEPEAPLPRRTLANTLPYQDGVPGAVLLRALQDCSDVLPRGAPPPLAPAVRTDRRLTIGLLSGSLRTHPVGWLTIAGFEHLDPALFRIVCLSRAPEPADPISRRFQAVASDWVDTGILDDEALARQARAMGIDILIDLGGYGEAARMLACARRLAPVQVKWVGMQNHSSGLAEMDWFITDRWETPPALEGLYSERLLRMPDGYVCYSPPPHAPDVGPAPAARNGFVTFGCFNNIAKITPRTVAAWCEILRAAPDTRMILKTHQLGHPDAAARFAARFAADGVDPRRVEMRGSSGHRAFLATYNEVDLVLDPFPYSGGLTTCEALWMGVPTITIPGESFASRHSASHLSNAGYGDWVVGDTCAYIARAAAWAGNPRGLAEIRAGMRERVRVSPLVDAPRFGRNLGLALRHAWFAG